MGSWIAGTGIALPDMVVTNDDLARIMDTSDQWVRTRTGVRERRFVEPGVGSSDLAVDAAAAAIDDAGIDLDDVDVLVTATMTPDYQAPGNAGLIQHKLGLGPIAGYDLREQCSGFLYGMDLADSLITSGRADTVVVVGSEVHAGYLPWREGWDVLAGRSRSVSAEEFAANTRHRAWSVLFGDGAGAMVIRRGSSDDSGFLTSALHTDGAHVELITVQGLGFVHRPFADAGQIQRGMHIPQMDGAGLYRQAVRLMPEAVKEVAFAAGVDVADIDLVVAHQANARILDGVRRQLGATAATVPSNIANHGNTTSATLPILFHELRTEGRVESGALTCFVAFGAGAHWGAALYRCP